MILKQLAQRSDLAASFLIGRISIAFTKSPDESFLTCGHFIISRSRYPRRQIGPLGLKPFASALFTKFASCFIGELAHLAFMKNFIDEVDCSAEAYHCKNIENFTHFEGAALGN